MNATYSMRVEENLKKQFLKKSKASGIDGSVLIRYFMKTYVEQDNVVHIDIDEKVFDALFQSPEFISGFKDMSRVMKDAGL